jgi:hypothetical protein
LIEIVNGRKIGAWTGRHVAPQDVRVPKMDNADGRMLETGLNRGLPAETATITRAAGTAYSAPTIDVRDKGQRRKWLI